MKFGKRNFKTWGARGGLGLLSANIWLGRLFVSAFDRGAINNNSR